MELKTINIKGKEYVTVNERIKCFREIYKDYSLISELVELTENRCVIKATVITKEGVVVATGFAHEDRSDGYINKTSYVENCETSAWGRALGNLGIGIDTSIASAEEVEIAVVRQEQISKKEDKKSELKKLCIELGMKESTLNEEVKKTYKKANYKMCNDQELDELITSISKIKGK